MADTHSFVRPAGNKSGCPVFLMANRRMEVLRWTVRMAKDRKLFTPAQFEFGETQSHTPTFVIDWPLNEWVSYDSLLRCRPVAKVGVWYCR